MWTILSPGLLPRLYFSSDSWGPFLSCSFLLSPPFHTPTPLPMLERISWCCLEIFEPVRPPPPAPLHLTVSSTALGRYASHPAEKVPLAESAAPHSPQPDGFQFPDSPQTYSNSPITSSHRKQVMPPSFYNKTCLPGTQLFHAAPLSATSVRPCMECSVLVPWAVSLLSNTTAPRYTWGYVPRLPVDA